MTLLNLFICTVAPREGRVSRNGQGTHRTGRLPNVAPREGRVSRNDRGRRRRNNAGVAPREGRVSRNGEQATLEKID